MARNSALNVHTLADVDQRRPILAQDEPSVRRPHCEASRDFRRLGKFERLASRIIARVQRVRSREDCVMSRAGEIAFFHSMGERNLSPSATPLATNWRRHPVAPSSNIERTFSGTVNDGNVGAASCNHLKNSFSSMDGSVQRKR